MKDFKIYVIGFLSATCLFLFMGQSNNDGYFKKIYADEIVLGNSFDEQLYLDANGILLSNKKVDKLVTINPLGFGIADFSLEDFFVTLGIDDSDNGAIELKDKYGKQVFIK
tara:strand:+ start:63 stop:395 length:333 start_codon:yes stop_codon:yes gene_type:complete